MNTEEIKAQLIEAGATEEDITKVDFAKNSRDVSTIKFI